MSTLDLAATMDAFADAAKAILLNVYAYPAGKIEAPAIVVGYPKSIDFDATFKSGSDRAEFPIYYVVGRVDDKAARDALSVVIQGADSIKAVFDGDLNGAVQTCRVTDCQVTEYTNSGIQYLGAVFTAEVYS